MAQSAKRPCHVPGCSGYSEHEGYCQRHSYKRASNRPRKYTKRKKTTQRGYGTNHQQLRKIIKYQQPMCAVCGDPANELDHVDGNAFNLSRDNLQMLCKSCHSKKTVKEQGGGWNAFNKKRRVL